MAQIINSDGTEVAGIAGEAGSGGPLVMDSSTATFAADVVEASVQTPVIVDFWAPWCEPCKQLTPTLQKIVNEYAGAVRLAKVNIDENAELAAQLRVQSIPMVVAFADGKPVDAFSGTVPESQLRQFIERLTGNAGSSIDRALDSARAELDAGDVETANAIFAQIHEAEPENLDAIAGLARCYMAAGAPEGARALIDELTDPQRSQNEIAGVISALDLATQSVQSGNTDELQRRLDADPNDHAARFELAVANYGLGQAEQAIEDLLEIIRRDQNWNEEAARIQLLKIFEALGHSDPRTMEGRRKLSSLLFA